MSNKELNKTSVKIKYDYDAENNEAIATPTLMYDGKVVLTGHPVGYKLPDQVGALPIDEVGGFFKDLFTNPKKAFKRVGKEIKKVGKKIYKGAKKVLRSKAVKSIFNLAKSPVGQGVLTAFAGPGVARGVSAGVSALQGDFKGIISSALPTGLTGIPGGNVPGFPQISASMLAKQRNNLVTNQITNFFKKKKKSPLRLSAVQRNTFTQNAPVAVPQQRASFQARVTQYSPNAATLMLRDLIARLQGHLAWIQVSY